MRGIQKKTEIIRLDIIHPKVNLNLLSRLERRKTYDDIYMRKCVNARAIGTYQDMDSWNTGMHHRGSSFHNCSSPSERPLQQLSASPSRFAQLLRLLRPPHRSTRRPCSGQPPGLQSLRDRTCSSCRLSSSEAHWDCKARRWV